MERIADYTFVRSLGEGNHGQFFLAKPPPRLPVQAEYVAVKVLGGNINEDTFRRATRELRAFASVTSPHLVNLFDAGQEGPTLYYAMEYFPLGSLAIPSRPLNRQEIRRAIADAARGAHALHEVGVVHRDIKPANIMITEDGGKLSDLGLAQFLAPGLTVTGMGPIGSIEFMDPALMRGERASRGSDVWSLGVSLHRVLTGTSVYGELPETDPILALRKVLSTSASLHPSLDPMERELVQWCLALDPAERPSTAEEWADRIDQLPPRD